MQGEFASIKEPNLLSSRVEKPKDRALTALALRVSRFGSRLKKCLFGGENPHFVTHSPGIPLTEYMTSWRRECDWDPKASEFVATILLGRVRLNLTHTLKIRENWLQGFETYSPR